MEKKKSKFIWYDNFVAHTVFTLAITLLGSMFAGIIIGIPLGIHMMANVDMQELSQTITEGGDTTQIAMDAMATLTPFWETLMMYILTIGTWIVAVLFFLPSRNRPLFKTFMPKKVKGNTIKFLLLGILIGFGLNGLCILVAALHGDISLTFTGENILAALIIFLSVFIQSSSEELICRGYLYQKLLHRYKKPVVAILGNSILFSLLHIFNDGVTALALLNILLSGIMFSLLVYYFDSLWCAFAAHTAWNYTQNILFGLPNSGIRVPFSFFNLDEAAARDSFAYNVDFGVEGTVLAVVVLALACLVIYLIGSKKNMQPTDIWAEYDEAQAAKLAAIEAGELLEEPAKKSEYTSTYNYDNN